MNKTCGFALSALIAATGFGARAEVVNLSLEQTIERARVNSVDAAVALDELRQAYWEYRTYRAELLPEVTFEASLPSYYKQYTPYMNSEGAYSFVRNNYMELSGQLSATQNIWLTGGQLSLTTNFDYYRDIDSRMNRYMSLPLALTLNQPIFGVNSVKWDRKIEPVRYAEAKAAFLSASEDVAMTAITNYFTLLMARENLDIATQNLANAEKLYDVAREKRAMGQISENDLLQMELNVLDARSDLTARQSSMKSAMFTLRAFLDYGEDVELVPQIPYAIPNVDVTYVDAEQRALANNKFARNVRRRQLEADYAVAKAKGDLRQIDLYAQVGFTGTSNEVSQAYKNLRSNQVVEIGVKIPLIDWGKRRGNVRVAESNRRVVESKLRQETLNFKQDLFILVERFCNQQMQLDIAQRADTIAQRRYNTNVETYLIGRISTLDLNDSQVKKDEARQEMVNELYLYWYYYYQLRSLTLWNYADRCSIDADIERMIKQ